MSLYHHSLATEGQQSFVLDDSGFVWAFGYSTGNLGIGGGVRDIIESQNVPEQVHDIENIVSISSGGLSKLNLFLSADGKIYGVGKISRFHEVDEPELIRWTSAPETARWQTISSGQYSHQLFIDQDGGVWSAGTNARSERGHVLASSIGPFDMTRVFVPRAVDAIAGNQMSLVLDTEGRVWSFGWNKQGQCGIPGKYFPPETVSGPTIIPGLPKIVMIATGLFYSVFLDEQGQIWVCGDRDPSRPPQTPVPRDVADVKMIPGIIGARYITSGDYVTYYIGQDGYAYYFGLDNTPKKIEGASNLVEISAGNSYILAIDYNGQVWARGKNLRGQLGLGQDKKYVAHTFEQIPGIRAKIQSFPFIENMQESTPTIEITYPVFDALVKMGFEFGIVEQDGHEALVEIIDGDNNIYRTRIAYDPSVAVTSPPANPDNGFKYLEEAIKSGLENYDDRTDIPIEGGQAIDFVDSNGQRRIIAVVSSFGQVFPYPT